MFGKYFTHEPFLNYSFRENVEHVAILITYEDYKQGPNKAMCNVTTAPHCRKRMLQFFKDGPFDNGTIERRLELIEGGKDA